MYTPRHETHRRESIRLLLASIIAAPGSAQEWPDISKAPARVGGGQADAAVLIGVDKYVFVPRVAGAADNARAWHAWLTETRGLDPSRVSLLVDTDASREGILDAAEKAARQVKDGGTLWFVFIGHGAPAKDGSDGVLVGVDAQQKARSLFARSVRQQEIITALKKGKQGQTVLLVDACFSGRTDDGKPLVEGLQPLVVTKTAAPTGATVLSAGTADQFAGPLPGVRRPAFSYLVLGALRGWGDLDGDGAVTASEAVIYSNKVLRTLLKDRTQTPQLNGLAVKLASKATEAGPELASLARRTPKATASAAPQTGRKVAVDVVVDVPARVYIDDKPVGESPIVDRMLVVGNHVFAVEVDGERKVQERYIDGRSTIHFEFGGLESARERETATEWFRIAFAAGNHGVGVEGGLFTLRWKHLYWTILSGAYQANGDDDELWAAGTTLGYPLVMDVAGKHELRFHVGLEALWIKELDFNASDGGGGTGKLFFGFGMAPGLTYVFRPWVNVSVQIGFVVHVPVAGPGGQKSCIECDTAEFLAGKTVTPRDSSESDVPVNYSGLLGLGF